MNVNNSILPLSSKTIESVPLKKSETLEAEKQQLLKTAKQMESIFLNQLLKSMRATIPKADDDNTGLGGGMGKDIYTEMFDEQIANKMAGMGNRSIASMIYRSMEKVLIAEHSCDSGEQPTIKDVMPEQKYIKINNVLSATQMKQVKGGKGDRGDRLSSQYDKVISKIAEKYEINPNLIKAVIKTESNFDKNAVSPAGAKGLMQLIDTTASDMKVDDVFNPVQNIEGGTKYLKNMIDRFGDVKTALAAYNAGPGTVENYGGLPPYKETREYVERVLKSAGEGQLLYRDEPVKEID